MLLGILAVLERQRSRQQPEIRLRAPKRLPRQTQRHEVDECALASPCVSEEYDDISVISLTVYTDGINQLSRLFSKLEGVEGVIRVVRAKSLSPAAASR